MEEDVSNFYYSKSNVETDYVQKNYVNYQKRFHFPDLSVPPPSVPVPAPTVANPAPSVPSFNVPPPSVPLSKPYWPSTEHLNVYDNYKESIPTSEPFPPPPPYSSSNLYSVNYALPDTYSVPPPPPPVHYNQPNTFASHLSYSENKTYKEATNIRDDSYDSSKFEWYDRADYERKNSEYSANFNSNHLIIARTKKSCSPSRISENSKSKLHKTRLKSNERIDHKLSESRIYYKSSNHKYRSRTPENSDYRNRRRSPGNRSVASNRELSPSSKLHRRISRKLPRLSRSSPKSRPPKREFSESLENKNLKLEKRERSKGSLNTDRKDEKYSDYKIKVETEKSRCLKNSVTRKSGKVRRSSDKSSESLSTYRSRKRYRKSSESGSDKEKSKSETKNKFHMKLPSRNFTPVNRVFGSEEKSDVEEEREREKYKSDSEKAEWIRSSPADLYYRRDEKNPSVMKATQKLINLCNSFEESLVKRAQKAREKKESEEVKISNEEDGDSCNEKAVSTKDSANSLSVSPSPSGSSQVSCRHDCKEDICHQKKCQSECPSLHEKSGREKKVKKTSKKSRKTKHVCVSDCSSSDSGASSLSDSSSSSCDSDEEEEWSMKGVEEMEKKKTHPDRLHPELWFNDPGEMNDGPLCRCSLKARRSGIRHGYYAGEDPLEKCNPFSNNANRLYHYFVTISPPTNFLVKTPTIIVHDSHEFIFEGFSLLSHHPLEEVPTCQVIRFNIEYSIFYVEEKLPENFCVRELELFYDFLFKEILELVDLNFKAIGDDDGCSRFHFMPRFVRQLPDNGKEVLSMNEVLNYLFKSSIPLVKEKELDKLINLSEHDWLNYTDKIKGMVVTYPGKKPCSIRVDQLDRDQLDEESISYPVIVHFGIRPPQLSYAGNPEYQKALREYVKFRHLLANMPKPSFHDKRRLELKENRLQEMRMASKMKRDVTITISSEGFYRTGIMCDIVQHALLIPVLVRHLRFHRSLNSLEAKINYKFKTRLLLQLALTHPSYRENFGTNPDHARNSLTNCGVRQPQYGDRRIHFMNTHKRGINTLVNIMSRFGKNEESESKITHNERLEFLGDAVVEFLTSIHLFHLFPNLEEGGLATYRAAVVQNQHLSVLADKLSLHQYVLHAHGSDLCHTFELRHAMANCFEALMGAIFIDSNIEAADAVFSATLFRGEDELHTIWVNYKPHPLQEQEPQGDRRWIETFPILQKLAEFEESIGITFTHIRLLARAFTDRSIGFNYLTLGSNQRLEFLGDTVLQLVASEYLYRFFPEHHEGHLSLLRSSLVNNRTQAVVCDDLAMTRYAMYSNLKTELKTKDRADLLEAFLGAVYIDRGLDYCRIFCLVCFFPRLQQFIINQEWNDPKSKLQQCCLTLRTMEGGEPDIPVYKVIECKGPTNTRVYTVAVYFKDKRLAKASGHSIQQAEMNAAKEALLTNKQLFPQLAYQKRVIEKNIKIQGVDPYQELPSHGKKNKSYSSRESGRYKRGDSISLRERRDSRREDRNKSHRYDRPSYRVDRKDDEYWRVYLKKLRKETEREEYDHIIRKEKRIRRKSEREGKFDETNLQMKKSRKKEEEGLKELVTETATRDREDNEGAKEDGSLKNKKDHERSARKEEKDETDCKKERKKSEREKETTRKKTEREKDATTSDIGKRKDIDSENPDKRNRTS